MVDEMMRTHVVVPRELVTQIDELVGQRKRSEFVTEALREKVARERRREALKEAAGMLDPADHPEWDSSARVSEWVRTSRAEDDRLTERELRGSDAV